MDLYQIYSTWSKEKEKKYQKNPYKFEKFRINEQGIHICPYGRKYPKITRYIKSKGAYNKTIILYEYESCEGCRLKKQCAKVKRNRQSKITQGLDNLKKEVRDNLDSALRIELRIKRSIQVEVAFGVSKVDMKFRRFTRTGLSGIKTELYLLFIGYNLRKHHNKKNQSFS